jgi:hypothetical protein
MRELYLYMLYSLVTFYHMYVCMYVLVYYASCVCVFGINNLEV